MTAFERLQSNTPAGGEQRRIGKGGVCQIDIPPEEINTRIVESNGIVGEIVTGAAANPLIRIRRKIQHRDTTTARTHEPPAQSPEMRASRREMEPIFNVDGRADLTVAQQQNRGTSTTQDDSESTRPGRHCVSIGAIR